MAKALKLNEGVDTIFTLCGGHIIDIYDGCLDEGIRIIDVRHEQVAAHAADGYARQTGKLGCVVTTAGPGCTNAVTGIATAFRSESPVLHIGGQGALTQHKMGSLQDLPHVDMMAPITKFAAGVRSTERVADMVSMAARECFAGAYGPSYLEIPARRARPRGDGDQAVMPGAGPLPRLDQVDRRPGRHREAGRPAGGGRAPLRSCSAPRSGCAAATRRPSTWCARSTSRPTSTAPAAACCRRAIRTHFNRTRRMAFDKADVIVIVGTPFDFRMGYGKRLRRDATVVQIDMDYRTVGKNRDVSLGLVGDPGRHPRRGATRPPRPHRQRRPGRVRTGWLELRAAERQGDRQADAAVPVRSELADPSLPGGLGDQRVPDRGHDLHRRRRRRGDHLAPRRCSRAAPATGWTRARSALGVGTGFAMAAKLAHPDKEVLCYYGDGSFGMTAFDMETANRFGAPYIAVIGNNSAMNQIRYGQIAKYGEQRGNVGNKLGDVPFSSSPRCSAAMARRSATRTRSPRRCRRAREAVQRDGKSAVVNIWVDPNEYAPGTKAQTMYK